ncbi:MAG: response regulator transcription factor [Prevotella sp.]|mgnify:CR=1 FL=1|nr:response regulator transcription factor [Prevotella sp.]
MIRCMAIDDEPLALQQIVAYIGKVPFLELAAQCQSALEARDFLEHDTVDAIFCDINMPDLNGMDFIKSLAVPPLVVFTTAYSEYAVEGFRVNAVDYLLKPFGLQDFQRAANRIKERLEMTNERYDNSANRENAENSSKQGNHISHLSPLTSQLEDDTLFLKTEYRIVKVSISDIRYVEAMSEYLKVWLSSEPKPIITLLSMKKMEERLPDTFMRIHRSYIINLTKIQEVNKNRVIMDADTYLPIGDNYKEAFQAYLDTKFLGK